MALGGAAVSVGGGLWVQALRDEVLQMAIASALTGLVGVLAWRAGFSSRERQRIIGLLRRPTTIGTAEARSVEP